MFPSCLSHTMTVFMSIAMCRQRHKEAAMEMEKALFRKLKILT